MLPRVNGYRWVGPGTWYPVVRVPLEGYKYPRDGGEKNELNNFNFRKFATAGNGPKNIVLRRRLSESGSSQELPASLLETWSVAVARIGRIGTRRSLRATCSRDLCLHPIQISSHSFWRPHHHFPQPISGTSGGPLPTTLFTSASALDLFRFPQMLVSIPDTPSRSGLARVNCL